MLVYVSVSTESLFVGKFYYGPLLPPPRPVSSLALLTLTVNWQETAEVEQKINLKIDQVYK